MLNVCKFKNFVGAFLVGLSCLTGAIAQTSPTAANSDWVLISPDASPGNGIAIDPKDPRIMYIALRPRGIYKSIDGGKSWAMANQGIVVKNAVKNGIAANDIFIHPLDRRILYVGLEWNGVYKSIDGGKNWQEHNSGIIPGGGFNAVTFGFHPKDKNILLLGTDAGLYKTIDGGKNWRFISNLPVQTIETIVFDFKNPNTVYASIYVPQKGVEAGVWKSLDGGEKWKAMNKGLPEGSIFEDPRLPYNPKNGSHGLLINPQNHQNLAVATGGGLYYTLDGGETWQRSTGAPYKTVRTLTMRNPKKPKIYAFVYQSGVYGSEDFGKTWQLVSNTLNESAIWRMTAHPKDNIIYVGGRGITKFDARIKK